MNIKEAVEMALEKGCLIRRRSWFEQFSSIKPTNTIDGCLLVPKNDKPPVKWWNPQADDLIAEDWILVETMTFAEKLKKLREKSGLTQKQLAQALNVTKSAITMYETGDRSPDLVKLKKMAAILGCTTDELLEPIDIS